MPKRITWDTEASRGPSYAGSAAILQMFNNMMGNIRTPDILKGMGERRKKAATGDIYRQLASLTDTGSYSADATGILGNADPRRVDMEALAKFQQNRGTVLQQRQNTGLDMARKTFQNAHLQEDQDIKNAQAKAYVRSTGGDTEYESRLNEYLTSHRLPDNKGVAADAAVTGAADAGLPTKAVAARAKLLNENNPHQMQRRARAEIDNAVQTVTAKEYAKGSDYKGTLNPLDPRTNATWDTAKPDSMVAKEEQQTMYGLSQRVGKTKAAQLMSEGEFMINLPFIGPMKYWKATPAITEAMKLPVRTKNK